VINVQVQKLGLLPSLAASVNRATNRIAVTETGSIVGELNYEYSNTGVDYIPIDAPGTPLYAGSDKSAVKLTEDQGRLFLSFPKWAYRNLEYVYFATREPLKPVDLIEIPLARTDLPISTAVTQIYLPREYYILYTFGADGGSEFPGLEIVLFFLVVSGAIGYGLKRRRFLICYIVFCAGLAVFSAPLLALFLIVSTIIILRRSLRGNRNILGIIAGALILIFVVSCGALRPLLHWAERVDSF